MKKNINIFKIITFLFLSVYVLMLLYPLFWAAIQSIKSYDEYILNPTGLPKSPTLNNYLVAFQKLYITIEKNGRLVNIGIWQMLLNSIVYAGGAFLAAFMPCLLAYATQRFHFKFSKIIYSFVIVAMIIPIVGNTPSVIRILNVLGIYDSLIGILIYNAGSCTIFYLVYYAAFQGISRSYDEAAEMDGASRLQVFTKILFPLVKNTFLTVLIINFIGYWNDYQAPLLYIKSYPTLAYGMYSFSINSSNALSNLPMKVTGSMILLLPILLIFVVFSNRLMGNLTVGGVKE